MCPLNNVKLCFFSDPTKADDASYTREKETEEIAAILPEIREKIQDTRDMEAESLKKIEDKKSEEEGLAKANGNGERGDAPNGGCPLTIFTASLRLSS